MKRTVAVVTLGCSRNEVDSEELAGRLAADGWTLVDDFESAEVALVNTCGFIDSAKKDSIDTLLEANSLKGHGQTRAVVAVGCMAERYGNELAEALPDTDAILSFDDYQDISARLQSIVAGNTHTPHIPRDRRALLPIAPADRAETRESSEFSRKRLGDAPWAPLKIASGCDRRCSFCAIPYFRGSFISRRPHEVLDEARWLVANGVTELFLVSENTTSYGKDLGDLQLMEKMLPEIAAIEGVERVRLSYLQPAEMRPTLIQAMIATPKTVPYFDLSFQHSSPTVLRRMRRFGDNEKFLHLISQIRALSPTAGIRSNFIVGFPGETEEDFQCTLEIASQAMFDNTFEYIFSPRDGTEAATMGEHFIDPAIVSDRFDRLKIVVEHSALIKHEERVGRIEEVVVQGPSRRNPSVYSGRTRQYKLVHFSSDTPLRPGTYATVQITKAAPHFLTGFLVEVLQMATHKIRIPVASV